MRVVTIVGAQPQFIKCALISRALREIASEILLHTGQHYDDNMSEVFFRDLGMSTPDYNLGVGSGPQGVQTAEMLKGIEEVLVQETPDVVIVYGDTNSTVAGALAAEKLRTKVAHIEAGLRSYNRRMPGEINRVLTDHLSDHLFCPTETARKNLEREGITAGVYWVGDVMYDSVLYNAWLAEQTSPALERLDVSQRDYALATVHWAENTDDPVRLGGILAGLEALALDFPVILPLHPRTRKSMQGYGIQVAMVRTVDPIS
jgi:UDP-N-acetylglucosamine 2-epimerase